MVPNGAVTSAVLVHLRVEPAHFDWHWRERPALALLAWEALARDPVARLRRIQVESTGTTINFRPAAITHRDIAASALLIASRLALTATVDALARRAGTSQPKAKKIAPAARWRGGKRASIGTSWSEVTISWDDGEASSVSHNGMAKVERVPTKIM